MPRVLLFDHLDEYTKKLKAALRLRKFDVSIEDQKVGVIHALQQHVPQWELVVIVARKAPEESVLLLREFITASHQVHQSGLPQFLFASFVQCSPSLRIQIAELGARYVHV